MALPITGDSVWEIFCRHRIKPYQVSKALAQIIRWKFNRKIKHVSHTTISHHWVTGSSWCSGWFPTIWSMKFRSAGGLSRKVNRKQRNNRDHSAIIISQEHVLLQTAQQTTS